MIIRGPFSYGPLQAISIKDALWEAFLIAPFFGLFCLCFTTVLGRWGRMPDSVLVTGGGLFFVSACQYALIFQIGLIRRYQPPIPLLGGLCLIPFILTAAAAGILARRETMRGLYSARQQLVRHVPSLAFALLGALSVPFIESFVHVRKLGIIWLYRSALILSGILTITALIQSRLFNRKRPFS